MIGLARAPGGRPNRCFHPQDACTKERRFQCRIRSSGLHPPFATRRCCDSCWSGSSRSCSRFRSRGLPGSSRNAGRDVRPGTRYSCRSGSTFEARSTRRFAIGEFSPFPSTSSGSPWKASSRVPMRRPALPLPVHSSPQRGLCPPHWIDWTLRNSCRHHVRHAACELVRGGGSSSNLFHRPS